MFLLTRTVMVPEPEVRMFAFAATFTASVPGVGSSFCRSRSRLAFAAKVIEPFRFTVSLPVPPLMVRLGIGTVKAPTLMMSSPAAAFAVMAVTPVSESGPEPPTSGGPPSTVNVRPATSNWMFPAPGSETASVSLLPPMSVTVIALPVVVTV